MINAWAMHYKDIVGQRFARKHALRHFLAQRDNTGQHFQNFTQYIWFSLTPWRTRSYGW